jgi:hypothetical protein
VCWDGFPVPFGSATFTVLDASPGCQEVVRRERSRSGGVLGGGRWVGWATRRMISLKKARRDHKGSSRRFASTCKEGECTPTPRPPHHHQATTKCAFCTKILTPMCVIDYFSHGKKCTWPRRDAHFEKKRASRLDETHISKCVFRRGETLVFFKMCVSSR